jgi:hypothetical protein
MSSNLAKKWQTEGDSSRIFYMLVVGFCYGFAKFVLFGIIFFLAITYLATGRPNDRLLVVGAQFSAYIYQVFRYLTFNSEQRPFPFSDWPKK